MMNTKVSVAMATYNGEKYLREQLDSLSQQESLPWELIVCDDGSTDGTIGILEDFAARATFPVHIHRNEANLGFADNFLKAASLCSGDWISFCDQDDVWLPNKIADCLSMIESNSGLTLVLQRAQMADERLQTDGRVFPDRLMEKIYPAREMFGIWVWLGFLQTVRADLFALPCNVRPLNDYKKHRIYSHDKWTCLIANALGGIAVIDRPAALYRRHEATVTGTYARVNIGQRFSRISATGFDEYTHYADVAESCGQVLDNLSDTQPGMPYREALEKSAQEFRNLARIYALRSRLYGKTGRVQFGAWLRILISGGYFGPKMRALGGRSAMKDAVVVLVRAIGGVPGGRQT